MSSLWIVLVIAALISAWYLGYFARQKHAEAERFNLPRDYLVGLNFLLNEETDKAVDIFIKMLTVDTHTVETHLAVGKLFRRRGEVDRAIRIHQNLIARPNLDKFYREQSLFELGQDYLAAGVLDRAERIFLEVMNTKAHCVPAIRALLDIYQQGKDWKNAMLMANKLEFATQQNMQPIIAHYYCELAEIEFAKERIQQGNQYLKLALAADPNSVRASLLHSKIDIKQSDYKSALRNLKRIRAQDTNFFLEAINGLVLCYEALQEEEKLVAYLLQVLQENPGLPIIYRLAERLQRWQGDQFTVNFIIDHVQRWPSLHGLQIFINLSLSQVEGKAHESLLVLEQLIKKLLTDRPDYRCISCGFSGKTLHWLCPGCKQWNVVKPAMGLEMTSS